ncbi:bifunctional p-450:NADPH-p450 reductase [Colletotrichum truncatum]|uniref:Bifunctional p-450:NADPH-p450 reductase n=1 Tax=Colletotrichum truncatum TaxID=5467 RepID=A0ACC3ZB01_COLTU|nr:bifunctional p-450:NADPH-p450 reductase [Colletotrichum truncatum]KAF6783191.1 bifunctional p-450:NADPH-p450 reductase [Colletotrichum truncatum]
MSSISNSNQQTDTEKAVSQYEKRKRFLSLSRRSTKSTSNMEVKTVKIPEPPRVPLLGNVTDIDMEYPLGSFIHLANKYGPIYKVDLLGQKTVWVNTHALVNEICGDDRFKKSIDGELEDEGFANFSTLKHLREAVHDGLFTSKGEEEENWGVAHRVLMAAFGPLAIRGMFDDMHDLASQLALKWARHGSSTPISIGEDMTRLTMDTVALCSMGFRFNSYYREDTHPFITAMYRVLKEAGDKTLRVLPQVFYKSQDKKYKENINLLRTTAREVLQARKEDPNGLNTRKDLLTAMLTTVDTVTGRKMTDESIIDNLITFLVAGHETTAATFSFTMYWLIKRPEVYRKVQQEIDSVVGEGPIRQEHVGKLKYLSAVLRETLRFSAPIPAFAREAKKDEILGGKYPVKAGETLVACLAKSHFDPAVYGDDAEEFKPERMLDENFDRLMKEFPNCWSPFGTGMRGCIGRAFAWQEMLLALAVLFQNFNFVAHNPNYDLKIAQTLTIKPKDFYIRAILREGLTPSLLEARLAGSIVATGAGAKAATSDAQVKKAPKDTCGSNGASKNSKLAVFYGSNAGTCEFMAQRLASDAASHGFSATVDSLDTARESLPTDGPVVIITSSYEGQPPHNAALFVDWLTNLKGKELENVSYAVYGCGHGDWVKTHQRIPKLVDSSLSEHGATRLVPLDTTDAKDRDMFSDFEAWEDEKLWPALVKQFGGHNEAEDGGISDAGLSVSFSTPRTSTLRQDVKDALVIDSHVLVQGNVGLEKRHIELQLPTNMRYSAGDYMAVLPHNPKDTVARVMRRFHLTWDSHVTIQSAGPTTLPTNVSIPVSDVLSSYVELCQTATKRNISGLAQLAKDEEVRNSLQKLAADAYDSEVKAKRLSVLDITEKFPSLAVPFNHFLLMLPPMRVRQYSISSSPLVDPGVATLTYGVLDEPALSGKGRHIGVTSSYLSSLTAGDKVQVAVRPAQGGFKLPIDMDKTPILCVAAGTGLAPFRAFVQERAILIGNGLSLAPAILFFGCRDPAADDLYREEFDKWEALGAVKVYRAYSRKPEASDGCKYVQHRIWKEREMLYDLWDQGAKVYVCGSNQIAEGVKEIVLKAAHEKSEKDDGEPMSEEEMEEWFNRIRNERYATDVFD